MPKEKELPKNVCYMGRNPEGVFYSCLATSTAYGCRQLILQHHSKSAFDTEYWRKLYRQGWRAERVRIIKTTKV